MKNKVWVIIIALFLTAFVACTPKAPSEAQKKYNTVEQSGIKLEQAKIEDIITFMNRSADNTERTATDLRKFSFSFPDGSVLVFAMRAVATGGLVLDHYYAE